MPLPDADMKRGRPARRRPDRLTMATTNLIEARRRKTMLAASQRWQAHSDTRDAAAALVNAFGAGTADTPLKQVRFQARQDVFAAAAALRASGRLPVFIERKIGPTLDFMSAAPSEAARGAGRPVARIVGSIDPHVVAEGFATGFLVHQEMLLTNWHVFPDKASAAGTGANFLYEQGERGIEIGITFAIEPERFFFSHEALDFALVAVAPQAVTGQGLADLGTIVPTEATSKILVGQPIDIINIRMAAPRNMPPATIAWSTSWTKASSTMRPTRWKDRRGRRPSANPGSWSDCTMPASRRSAMARS